MMNIYVKVEKDGVVSDTTLSGASIKEFSMRGVDLVEDTKKYLLKLTDLKIRSQLGNLKAEPTYTVTGVE